jgi:ribosome-associated toxin RatA of RatAB toxin-antitoxin module
VVVRAILLALAVAVVPRRVAADQTEALRKGSVFFRLAEVKGSRASRGFVRGVVHASIEDVFAVIVDYDRYEAFMPRVEECHVVSRRADGLRYHAKLDMPWPVSNVWYDTDVNWTPDRRRVRFEMVPGTGHGVESFDGHWRLAEFDGRRDRTLVDYDILFLPETDWPTWVMELGTKATLGKILPALRERLDRLRRPSR